MKRDERHSRGGSLIKAKEVNAKVKQLLYIDAFLPKFLELSFLCLANRANPIGRQILKWRVGRDATFDVTKLRVIDPFANRATILLHLFHVV